MENICNKKQNTVPTIIPHDLPINYPQAIQEYAQNLSVDLQSEISQRVDLRAIPTFTIDPEGAKDYDDALSIQEKGEGLWQVGVHIADVSHYVKEGDPIDQEAYLRGRSIYLDDRVVPMLPEILSNHLCSLLPGEERLCLSFLFGINSQGEVIDAQLCTTVIQSNQRLTYEEAERIISDKSNAELTQLDNLAKKIKEKQIARGALSIGSSEINYYKDENAIIGIYQEKNPHAHNLVETFMTLANQQAAQLISNGKGLFRNERAMTPKNFQRLKSELDRLQFDIAGLSGSLDSIQWINQCYQRVKSEAEKSLFRYIIMQSMPKAYYSEQCDGHYGLAVEQYTHFTSPIRRYTDLIIHRILKKQLQIESTTTQQDLAQLASYANQRESWSSQLEETVVQKMKLQYLERKKGNSFHAIVYQLNKKGIILYLTSLHLEAHLEAKELIEAGYNFDASRQIYHKGTHSISVGSTLKNSILSIDWEQLQVHTTFKKRVPNQQQNQNIH